MMMCFIEKYLDDIIKSSIILVGMLFLLIITTTSIVKYSTPFEYIVSLPFYYWIGLALIISNIILVIYYNKQYEPFNILLLLSLGLYIVGLPVLITENPRFHDTYLHGAETFPIILNGNTEGQYSTNYPISFILLANSLIISNIPNLTFFKLFELMILLSVIIILYYIAKIFAPRYALLTPFAFLGSNWVDKGYFSPQALALILYVTFFLSIYSYYKNKRINWLSIAILTSILIIFTNPTNSIILLINSIIIIITIYAYRYRYHEITNIAILILIISIGWNLYNAQYYVLRAEELGEELISSVGILSNLKITPAPSEGYDLVNQLRNIVGISVISTGLLFALLLFRSKRFDLIIISSILVSTILFLTLTAFTAPFLFGRSFMYITIAWSIALPVFILYISSLKTYSKGIKIGIISMLIIFLILIPITRYGRDATTYISYSIYNTSYLLSNNDSEYTLIADDPTVFLNKYTKMSLGSKPFGSYTITRMIESSIRQNKVEEELNKIIDLKNKPNAIFIASDFGKNQFILKYDKGDVYDKIENSYNNTNIIISTGNVRVYNK
jgi:hypothetical protein